MEGKTVLASNISKKLKEDGKKVLYLNNSNTQEKIQQQRKISFINKFLGYPDPRIDFDSPFLSKASNQLNASEYKEYNFNKDFNKVNNYSDILELNGLKLDFEPEYVLIELPSLINNNYPIDLISNSDLSILICRSNRLWSEADQAALNNILPFTGTKLNFIVNGVELKEVESLVGDLPKKGSKFRKKIKNMFNFQFYSKNQI